MTDFNSSLTGQQIENVLTGVRSVVGVLKREGENSYSAATASDIGAVGEAPNDSRQYARKNKSWVVVQGGGGGGADLPWATPQDYGAAGDGTTDDWSAIQNAINGNQIVYIPFTESGYKISRTLVISGKNQVIFGANGGYVANPELDSLSRISPTQNFQGTELIKLDSRAESCTLKGLHLMCEDLYSGRVRTAIDGILIKGKSDSHGYHLIEDMVLRSITGDGLICENSCWGNKINRVTIDECIDNGFVYYGTDSFINDVVVSKCGKHGFVVATLNTQLTHTGGANVFKGCKAYCNALDYNSSNPVDYYGFYVAGGHNRFVGCNSQQNCGGGVYISGYFNIFESAVIDGNGWNGKTSSGTVSGRYQEHPDNAVGLFINGIGNRVTGSILNNWLRGHIATAVEIGSEAYGENIIDVTADNMVRSYGNQTSTSADYSGMVLLKEPYVNDSNIININGKSRRKIPKQYIELDEADVRTINLTVTDRTAHELSAELDAEYSGGRLLEVWLHNPNISKRYFVFTCKASVPKPHRVLTRLKCSWSGSGTGKSAVELQPIGKTNDDTVNNLSATYSDKPEDIIAVFDLDDPQYGISAEDKAAMTYIVPQFRVMYNAAESGEVLYLKDIAWYEAAANPVFEDRERESGGGGGSDELWRPSVDSDGDISWLKSTSQTPPAVQNIKGPAGADGQDGADGADGITPTIGINGNWYLGSTDTGKPSRGEQGIQGIQGIQGPAGADGLTTSVTVNGETFTQSGGNINLGTVLRQHQSLAAYRTSAAQDVIDATKADKALIKTAMDSVATVNTQYFLGTQSAVSITLPSTGISVGDEILVCFTSGATAATLTCNLTGFDFTPKANKTSWLKFTCYDATNGDWLVETKGG